jgi:hypothetical protein
MLRVIYSSSTSRHLQPLLPFASMADFCRGLEGEGRLQRFHGGRELDPGPAPPLDLPLYAADIANLDVAPINCVIL